MNSARIPDDLYGEIHKAMPILCVDLAVLLDDRILLLKRKIEPDLGRFWFPGGRLRKLESLHEGAVRIAREEVGLSVDVTGFVGYTNVIFPQDPFGHGQKTHTVSLVFSCSPVSTEVRIDGNHSEFLWWDGKQVFADIPIIVRNLARKALEGGNG